jgi:hypothetical protein
VIVILALGCGCIILHAPSGRGTKAGAYDPVLLQQRMLRFADDYSSRLVVAMDSLPAPTNSADTITLLRLRLNWVSSIQTVATGPNELMNLADMFLLVTLTREIVQEQLLPAVYGQFAGPLLEACRLGETNITAIALTVVSPQQLNELRGAVARWRQENPDLRSALFTRALGLEADIAARQQQTTAGPGSLFTLLRLDPLAGFDPARRELTQTRLFGERTVFLAHRKPTLLGWQAELLVLETAATPPMLEVRSNATQVAEAVARSSKTMEQLPDLVRSERQAILNALPSQERVLTNLAAQLTTTLDAGAKMSESLNATLKTARGIQETAVSTSPFRIEEYTQSARQLEMTARQLTELLGTLNQTLASTNAGRLLEQITPVVQQAQAGSRAVADYIFHRALLLVAFTCASVLVTALAFRWIRKPASPP